MKQQLVGQPIIYTPNLQFLNEAIASAGNGNILLKDVLVITAEEVNGNGRHYPIELWEREVDKFMEKIQRRTTECIGELDHPDSSIINLKNGSHIIRKMYWNGKRVYADIEILCAEGPQGNVSGRILGSYLRNQLAIGFSTRGMGSLQEEDGKMQVQDDFDFITIDAVSNPSNQGSWGKLHEGVSKSSDSVNSKLNSIITEILCSQGTCPVW